MTRFYDRIISVREKLCLGGPCWLAGVKYAASTLGNGSGKPVSPLQPASAEQRKAIDDIAPL